MARSRRFVVLVACGAAFALLVAACGSADDAPPASAPSPTPADDGAQPDPQNGEADPLEELIAAAQAEGSLLWYSSPTEAISERVTAGFREAYGIDAQFLRLAGADLAARYSAEAEAGAVQADLVLHASLDFISAGVDAGWFVPLSEDMVPALSGFPEAFWREHTVIAQLTPFGICFNTDRLAADSVPATWEDVIADDFRDEILLADPNSSDAYIQLFDVLREEYGDDLLRGIAANTRQIYASGVPATEALGAGEGSLGVACTGGLADRIASAGAPVEFTAPDLTIAVEIMIGLSSDAENPNAARLFIEYILSPEGSALLNEGLAHVSPLGVGDGTLPADIRQARDDALERREEVVELLGAS